MLYKFAKMDSLKNEDLSWITSGYALKLKLLDTINFVEKFRWNLKSWLKPIFNILNWISNNNDYTIYFSEIIETSMTEKIDEALKLKELGYNERFISNYLGIDIKYLNVPKI